MTNIDQFESTFRSAEKPPFVLERIKAESILLITDLDQTRSSEYLRRVQDFLSRLRIPVSRWDSALVETARETAPMIRQIESSSPDVICTFRNLMSSGTEYPFSLGVHVDMMTQATAIPVLLMPRPEVLEKDTSMARNTDTVMAITDHLTGDHHLVSFAAHFTAPGGKLWLTHVEDRPTLNRYLRAIDRIPEIDSPTAREKIPAQLLKAPRGYIDSCQSVLRSNELPLSVETLIEMGDRRSDYRRLIDEHDVDLLVLNAKDADQLAMHGMAYPLTIELRETPMLLL